MMISIRRFAIFLCFGLFLLGSLEAQPDRITARVDSRRTHALAGHVHPLANPRNDRGALPDSFPMPGIVLMLKRSAAQQRELRQLIADQQNPASGRFHRWLTPEEYADSFGASAGDISRITDWLRAQGFMVTNVARSRSWISFSGTAAQARHAFHTEIHRYRVNGESHYANSTEPAIPAALADVVASLHGLSDFRPKPRLRRPSNPEMTTGGGTHHIAPDDFATIYDVAPLYQAGIDGSGQRIMVVGQSALRTSDLQNFRSRFNLPPLDLQQVLVPGRLNPGISPGDIDEANLDIEWSGAVARKATIVYVYSDDVWQSAMYAVDQNLGSVLSMSYGSCELSDIADLPAFQAVVQQANAQGITWFAAAGDSGAADCEDSGAAIAQDGLAVDIPAAIPEVTAMGGTEFNEGDGLYWSNANTLNGASALSYIPERAWNDAALGGGLAAGGGGTSTIFSQPIWQSGPGVPTDGARHVPDLALAASADHDGYYFYSGGGGYVGGTSAAVPTMAGIFALLNHYLVSNGIQAQPGLGNINPTLYRLAQNSSGVFHDVTDGDNVVPCASGSPDCTTGSFGLTAGPGYDPVTGWGSVDAYNLVQQWTSAAPTGSAVVASIDRNPVFQQMQPDDNGNNWVVKLTLTEEAGIATTLTDFTVDGTSYAAQIPQLFGDTNLPARSSLSASYGFQNLDIPRNVVFGFSGVDASGAQWTVQLSVPFNGQQTPLAISSMGNAASGQQAYAPGMMLTISGAQLGGFEQTAATIPLPQYLAGFEATVNGVPAPLKYVSPGQVTLQIPYETATGLATLIVGNPYQNLTYRFQVVTAAPGIFTDADGSIAASKSGSVGQTVSLFITGEGRVSPSIATGDSPPPGTPQARLPKPRLPVSVSVGGVLAAIQFIGIPSGMVGVTQIDYTIPGGVPAGVQPVVVTVGSASSPPANLTVTP